MFNEKKHTAKENQKFYCIKKSFLFLNFSFGCQKSFEHFLVDGELYKTGCNVRRKIFRDLNGLKKRAFECLSMKNFYNPGFEPPL